MPTGSVKWFDARRGFGFIVGPEGQDVFVHYSNIEVEGFRSLTDGESVEYELAEGAKGLSAHHVKRLTAAVMSNAMRPQSQWGNSAWSLQVPTTGTG